MATKILMASADTETLAALDTELSACLGDMQVGSAGAWRGVAWRGVAWCLPPKFAYCFNAVFALSGTWCIVCVSVCPASASLGRPSKRFREVRSLAAST
jgi:hypothetical protein